MGDRVEQRLGNYRLVRLLGRGSFAEVYLGEHTRLKSYAALKVLHKFLSEQDQEDFLAEGRTLVRLKHQHIVRLLDFDIEDDTPFLVMEYAPGGTLRRLHPKKTCVPLTTVVLYIQQLAEALDFAHERTIIHRDIKPENMLLGAQGEVLLSDFGIATIAHTTRSFRTEPQQAGTLPYMSPEQLRKHPRPASDQYALAVVAYEWLCGERPFSGAEWTLIYQHMHMPPQPLRERIPSLPQKVDDAIMRALAKDPHTRFASVRDFAQALAEAAGMERYFCSTSLVLPTNSQAGHISRIPTVPVVSTELQKSIDFSTHIQEQSVALLPAGDVGQTLPESQSLFPPSYPSNPSGQMPISTVSGSQPNNASWLQGTWSQRVILLLLSFSLIVASMDIAFTLASWQRSGQDDPIAMRMDTRSWAHRRQDLYNDLTSKPASSVFALNQRHATPWEQNPKCRFSANGYHVRVEGQDGEQDCLGRETHYEDFVLQVRMTIQRGEGGGLLFRAYSDPRLLYRFSITATGSYALAIEPGDDGPRGRSTAIKTGYNQENTLTVIARDEQILLYINGQYVDQWRDRQSLSGSIGVCAVRGKHSSRPVDVVFREIKVWVL
jgi:serine/threonine protein kinase